MEHRVASGDELPEGRLLEVDAGGKKVLLLRQDGVLRD